MSTGRKWGIWDRGKYKFSAEVQRAVDEGGKDLLVVLGINDVEDFAAGCSFSLVSEVLRMDEESRWPNCSNLQYLNMDLLLDQLQQVLKERLHLDEEHPQRGSLLEIAVTRFLPDIVQLLLAHGPEPQLVPRLLQGLYSSEGYKSVRNSRVQMQYILDYNVLLKHDPSTYFGAYCIKRTEKTSELERTTSSVKSSYAVTGYRDLGKLLGEDEDGSASMAWVHIPSSSVVTRAIERQYRQSGELFEFILEAFHPPVVAPIDPRLYYPDNAYRSSKIEDLEALALTFPCFALQSIEEFQTKRTSQQRTQDYLHQHGRSDNTNGEGTRVYLARTLDEASYPRLRTRILEVRNLDQVIQRQYRRENPSLGTDTSSFPILMVPQLWLWKCDRVFVSSFSMTRKSKMFRQGHTQDWHLVPQADISVTADIQIALLLYECIDDFGRPCHTDAAMTYQPTLDVFEVALSTLLSDVREYVRTIESIDEASVDIKEEGDFILSISDFQNELDMIETILQHQKTIIAKFLDDRTQQLGWWRKVWEEGYSFWYEELGETSQGKKRKKRDTKGLAQLCKRLESSTYRQRDWDMSSASGAAERGYKVDKIKELIQTSEHDVTKQFNRVNSILQKSNDRLDSYLHRIATLNRDANRVSKTIDAMLDLRRTHASVRLAESSIKLARSSIDEAHKSVFIGLVALGFAIVTIIFTPLAFVTSLLAVPAFAPDKIRSLGYTSNVNGILAGTEIATLIFTSLCVWLAYVSFGRTRDEDRGNPEQPT